MKMRKKAFFKHIFSLTNHFPSHLSQFYWASKETLAARGKGQVTRAVSGRSPSLTWLSSASRAWLTLQKRMETQLLLERNFTPNELGHERVGVGTISSHFWSCHKGGHGERRRRASVCTEGISGRRLRGGNTNPHLLRNLWIPVQYSTSL